MSIFPTKILLATDGSKDAQLAASTAIELANKTGSELHVVHIVDLVSSVVLDEADARELLDALVKRLEDAGSIWAQAHLGEGVPAAEIVGLGEEIDAGLIVVGSRGLGGVRRALMGSVSEAVTRHAHCAVLVVRKEER
ncbi:MAG TPA: universal stress protein [Rubrobacteraceae bacterium]|nr:universal stress protein [Rubrobacteraceae bacterium]